MSFTATDIQNASLYSAQRLMLANIVTLYRKYPHIGSHLEYNIRKADPETDYYYPSSFEHRAIMVDVKINQKLCEKLSCNFATPTGHCDPTSTAKYYRVGDTNNVELACQPACYNLLNKPTFDDTGKEIAHMTRLTYHNDNCALVPNSTVWAELPFFRSSEKYEQRVNDLPLGFNPKPNPLNSSGIGYTYNKPYCDAFFDSFDPKNEICIAKWYEELLNIVIGENIIKMVKAGITTLSSSGSTIPLPAGLPDVPLTDPKFELQKWFEDIDGDFVVPNPDADYTKDIIYFEKKRTMVHDAKLEELHIKYKNYLPGSNINRNISVDKRRAIELSNVYKSAQQRQQRPIAATLSTDEVLSTINMIVLTLLEELFTDPKFIAAIAIDVVLDRTLDLIKKQAKSIVSLSASRLAELMTALSKPIGRNLFSAALRTTVTQTVVKMTLKTIGTVVAALGRIVILSSSVIGIVLIVISLFDIILTFWDPLGFNKKYPPNYIQDIMRNSDFALRQQFDMTIPRIEFNTLVTLLLTNEEILQANINSFGWILEYLQSLEVNSEGARIDHGDEIQFDIEPSEIEQTVEESLASTKIYTPQQLKQYEQDHINRWRLSNSLQVIGIGVATIAMVLTVIKSHVVAIMIFTISIVILLLSQLNLEYDGILKSVNQEMLNTIFKYTST